MNSIWIVAASILAAFSISKAVDADGVDIEPVVEYLPGIVRYVDGHFA